MRATLGVLVMGAVLATAGAARGQTLVYSGAGAKASPGGGTRSVLHIGGEFFVFFDDGSQVVYATSADGASFSAPQSASGAPADFGFSVARRDAGTLGLVWGSSGAGGYQLWYREAAISGATLTFGAATLVASSATDVRGYLPTLLYSAIGTPFIAAIEYNRAYVPGSEGGCGPTARYRMVHYRFDGAMWQWQSYCNNFQTLLQPSSVALARSGANMIPSALVASSLASKVVNEATELGEPWNMVPSVSNTISGQLSAVQSLTTVTDVHYVYPDGAGTVGYARQDGTLVVLSANALDVTPVGAGSWPVIARPTDAAGCYTIAYVSGNSIRRRRFSGAIASLSTETTLFTTGAAPTNLSAELESGAPPALVWQVGSEIWFGLPADGAPPALTATPPSALADGVSLVGITGGTFRDTCGTVVPAGALVTVATTLGTIVEADADAGTAGIQVPADGAGNVSFTVRAPGAAGSAVVSAQLATGGLVATVVVPFTLVGDGGVCTSDAGCASGHCSPAFDDELVSYCTTAVCPGCWGGTPSGSCMLANVGIDPGDTCAAGASVTCQAGTCDGLGACAVAPSGTACANPVDMCTMDDACDGAGTCVPGPARVCDDLQACTTDSCDPLLGCVFTPIDCPDAGPVDAGPVDAGPVDGGMPGADAAPGPEAGLPGNDAGGSGADAGGTDWNDFGVRGGGCGCHAGGGRGAVRAQTGAALLLVLLLPLSVIRFRRRRR